MEKSRVISVVKPQGERRTYSGRQPEETLSSLLIYYRLQRVGNNMHVSYLCRTRQEELRALRRMCWVKQMGKWQHIQERERQALLLRSNFHQISWGTNCGFNCQLQSTSGMTMYTNKWRPCLENNINPILISFKASKQFIQPALSVVLIFFWLKTQNVDIKGWETW